MRDPGIAVALAVLLALGLGLGLGCEGSRALEPGEALDSGEAGSGSPTTPDADPRALDPIASSSAPQAWADWPLEDVSPRAWFGWRLEPSGEFTRSRLEFTTNPNALVLAIAEGTVRSTRVRDDGTTEIEVEHGRTTSRYWPLRSALVYPGLPVQRGTALGLVEGSALTLEVRVDDREIDPLLVIRSPLRR
ncbi:M23 family metallopeptidase [Nannocystaceae bacterium ST9]